MMEAEGGEGSGGVEQAGRGARVSARKEKKKREHAVSSVFGQSGGSK